MDAMKKLYSNGLSIKVSLYDFVINFNMMDADNNDEVIDAVKIFLSPQHAKALFVLLENNLKIYEEQFKTKLELPEDLMKVLQSRVEAKPE